MRIATELYLKAPARRNTEVMAQNSAARVRLGLLRDVSCASFIDSLNDGIKANLQPAKEKAISAGLEALRSLMRSIGDVKTGDIIDFDYSPDKGTTVHLNDKPVGEPIGGGRALYNAVLAIWLGDNAIDDGLKKKLLKSGD